VKDGDSAIESMAGDLESVGHWLQMDKPEEFNRILDDFLTSVDSGTLKKLNKPIQVNGCILGSK
jgi:hypothetical protein